MTYFVTQEGLEVHYTDIAREIAHAHKHLIGHHIFEQLAAVGMLDIFDNSTSPNSLPYSFSEYLP